MSNILSQNKIELPYQGKSTAHQLFSRVAQLPYSLLFDSAGAENNARFDIILVQPSQVLISENATHFVLEPIKNTKRPVNNPFVQINEWLKKYDQNNTDTHLPFTGGVAGALAYDLGRQIESLPSDALNELAIPDLVVGLYFYPLIIDHQQKTAQLFDFSSKNNSTQQLHEMHSLFIGTTPESQPVFQLESQWQSNMDRSEYQRKFDQVKSYIRAGDCYQINLAQRFSAPFTGSTWNAYQHLSDINCAPFSGYFNFDKGQLLSVSPERFIQVENQRVQTQPIKGTRPRGQNPDQDIALAEELKNSDKDRAENLMIVDLLRNDLGRTAVSGSVEVTELFGLHSFPSVHHLISTITSQIDENTTSLDVLEASFPGGSITGAPKIRAMEIIEELEPHRRHFYCGSLTYFSFNGKMDSNILIRSLISKDNMIYTWAGGGLVNDSDCELEYQETFTKLSKILAPLSQLSNSL